MEVMVSSLSGSSVWPEASRVGRLRLGSVESM